MQNQNDTSFFGRDIIKFSFLLKMYFDNLVVMRRRSIFVTGPIFGSCMVNHVGNGFPSEAQISSAQQLSCHFFSNKRTFFTRQIRD